MSKLWLLFSVVVMLQASRACDENIDDEQLAARENSADYFAHAYGFAPNAWDFPYYYRHQNPPVSGISNFTN